MARADYAADAEAYLRLFAQAAPSGSPEGQERRAAAQHLAEIGCEAVERITKAIGDRPGLNRKERKAECERFTSALHSQQTAVKVWAFLTLAVAARSRDGELWRVIAAQFPPDAADLRAIEESFTAPSGAWVLSWHAAQLALGAERAGQLKVFQEQDQAALQAAWGKLLEAI